MDEDTATEDTATDDIPLGDLLPGLADLPGTPQEALLGGPLRRHLARRDELRWSSLAAISPAEIAAVSGIGPVRTKQILSRLSSFVALKTSRIDRPEPSTPSDLASGLVEAVAEIAAWAVGTGRDGSLLDAISAASDTDSADVPLAQLDWLAQLPTSAICTPEHARTYDPVAVASDLIASFDERERAILDRVLDFDRSAPTLQEIGERFSVSRERIRQIEKRIRTNLDQAIGSPTTRPLGAAADRLRGRLGAAVPARLLVGEFAEYPPDLIDRLILHLAGPYRFDGDWYVLSALGDFSAAVRSTFESVAEDGIAPFAAFVDALMELGLKPEHAKVAVLEAERFRVLDDIVVDWSGSLATKATIALRIAGHPMSSAEIIEFVGPNSDRGLSNQVHADDRIVKVGVNRFALSEWGMDEFPGLVPTMVQRLSSGPMDLEHLRSELSREYAVSPNSVGIMASTHPAFLLESGVVMLRPEDRPYIPDDNIEGTRSCYLIDGVWSWRVPVDHDILRGSGRQIPEAFAVHLGAAPLASGSLDSPVGPIALSWRQYPAIGSLRAAARSLDAVEGDWMFVRRVRPSAIDFRLVPAAAVGDDPEQMLRCLIGAPDSDGDLEQVLADALGLRGSVNHDLAEERAALVARREHDLVELLDRIESEWARAASGSDSPAG